MVRMAMPLSEMGFVGLNLAERGRRRRRNGGVRRPAEARAARVRSDGAGGQRGAPREQRRAQVGDHVGVRSRHVLRLEEEVVGRVGVAKIVELDTS